MWELQEVGENPTPRAWAITASQGLGLSPAPRQFSMLWPRVCYANWENTQLTLSLFPLPPLFPSCFKGNGLVL